jgi:hypothetical protein
MNLKKIPQKRIKINVNVPPQTKREKFLGGQVNLSFQGMKE